MRCEALPRGSAELGEPLARHGHVGVILGGECQESPVLGHRAVPVSGFQAHASKSEVRVRDPRLDVGGAVQVLGRGIERVPGRLHDAQQEAGGEVVALDLNGALQFPHRGRRVARVQGPRRPA